MATRTITGPLYKPGGNIPWVNTTVTFTPRQLFATSAIGYGIDAYKATTDDNGDFSVTLAIPDSGAITYRITLSDGNYIDYALSSGATLTIADIINAGTTTGTPNELEQLLADHTLLDLADTPDTYTSAATKLLRVNSDGTGIEFVATGSGSDATYRHTQSIASASWVVSHGLGKRVSVSIVDSSGDVVYGNIHYDSDNQVTLTFSAAFSGEAYCN